MPGRSRLGVSVSEPSWLWAWQFPAVHWAMAVMELAFMHHLPHLPPTCLLPLPIQAQTRAGKTQKKSRVNCTDDAVNKPEVELVAAAATMATKDTGATATAAATATATAAATKDSSLLTKKVKLICYFSVDCGSLSDAFEKLGESMANLHGRPYKFDVFFAPVECVICANECMKII